jgi:hypothetical protein
VPVLVPAGLLLVGTGLGGATGVLPATGALLWEGAEVAGPSALLVPVADPTPSSVEGSDFDGPLLHAKARRLGPNIVTLPAIRMMVGHWLLEHVGMSPSLYSNARRGARTLQARRA